MQTAGLRDSELVHWFVCVGSGVGFGVGPGVVPVVISGVSCAVILPFSHDSISEPCISDHLRFSLADSTALLAASAAAPRSFFSTKFVNCQE